MGLNVSTQMSFENKDALKNAARDILRRSNASKETTEKIVEKPVFTNNYNSQADILRASAQITLNNSLRETLRYLRAQGHRKPKKSPVLGELWNLANKTKEETSDNKEIFDIEIDLNQHNIFAA